MSYISKFIEFIRLHGAKPHNMQLKMAKNAKLDKTLKCTKGPFTKYGSKQREDMVLIILTRGGMLTIADKGFIEVKNMNNSHTKNHKHSINFIK